MERMKNMLRKSAYRMYNRDNYIVVGRKRREGSDRKTWNYRFQLIDLKFMEVGL